MSDPIKHECGVALIRLLKPLDYYKEKYGTHLYGLNKLYLLMEKQHNRGQDGAGVGVVKMGIGQHPYFMNRVRSNSAQALTDIFREISTGVNEVQKKNPELFENTKWVKKNVKFIGELLMGHLRYGTHGKNELESCHPFTLNEQSPLRSLQMCGNFNLTNIEEIGWSEEDGDVKSDTAVVIDIVDKYLENEIDRIFQQVRTNGHSRIETNKLISRQIDFHRILKNAAQEFDGAYNMAGLSGTGVAFVLRDPNGIRPSYYYKDDEVVVAASERPAIQTTFNIPVTDIKELTPGCALIIDRNGNTAEYQCIEPREKLSCSFERIYFSRGSDVDIYSERKRLGGLLIDQVLKEIDYDFENTVFSYIPNTAETAFYGLIKAGGNFLNEWKKNEMRKPGVLQDEKRIDEILSRRLSIEKIAIKDVKLRTFITQDNARNEMVEHVYDITYGSIRSGIDTMVVIDDSIVRGTTLKRSIIKMLDRLGPKKIVLISSAPQIRYPDCYGIDMSKMKDFIAFRAAVELVNERGLEHVLDEIYDRCLVQEKNKTGETVNEVKRLYELFTDEEIADKIAQLVKDDSVKAEVKIIFQTIDNLHIACPNNKGDWYFSGNYPTAGGNKVANRAFINYMKGVDARAY